MMWVVFIHCVYWPGLFNWNYSSVIKSLLLIEMPLFLFIAGASNFLSKKRTAPVFYAARFQRILLPYWIYCAICILLNVVAGKFLSTDYPKWFSVNIPLVFSPVSNLPYLTGALWFVPIYLYIIVLFPVLRWFYEKYGNTNKKWIPLVIFTVLLSNNGWEFLSETKMVLYYSFWTYLGLFFPEIDKISFRRKARPVTVLVIVCALLTLKIVMQNNKFPPQYSLFILYFWRSFSVLFIVGESFLICWISTKKHRC